MDKRSDILLRRMLKDFAYRRRPPENGRVRLLWEASLKPRKKIDLSVLFFHPQIKPYPSITLNDWPQTLFTWINENSFQVGFQARLG